jgi:predicted ATPase
LALALARELRLHFADGVWLSEFSGLADPGLGPTKVPNAVRLELGAGEASARRVAQALTDRPLLVLNTCERDDTPGDVTPRNASRRRSRL